jgi:hypothetical protein
MRRGARPLVVVISFVISCGPEPRPPSGNGDVDGAGGCTDGETRCDGQTFSVCNNGNFVVIEDCPVNCTPGGCSSCTGPSCVSDSCEQAGANKSYIGCEYLAVDLENALEIFGPPIPVVGNECGVYPDTKLVANVKVCSDLNGQMAGRCEEPNDACPTDFTCQVAPQVCALDAENAPFAVVVSNPNTVIVSVTITNFAGITSTLSVDPQTIRTIFPQQLGFPSQNVNGSGTTKAAYKITSTAPIVAYQFNPLDDVDVFSNDASMLIPRAGYDTRYIAVSFPTLTRRGPSTPGRDHYNGFVTIVAAEDGTEISVTPTGDTVAGPGMPAIAAGVTQTFTLDAFDVLNLDAAPGIDPFTNDGLNGADLTGTLIQSTNGKPIGVFGGHEAAKISAPGANCCADHLEEMLFPTSTWGKEFAIHRTKPRGNFPDALRIVASINGTQVTITPPPTAGSCPILAAGGFCDVQIMQPTEITTSDPVTVAHLLMSTVVGNSGIGDPSLGIVPPVEQHRTDYKFLAPMQYTEQYVSLVAQAGDVVTLDGVTVTNWTPFGTGRVAAWVPIGAGAHRVDCPLTCSVEVYGWSLAVSYLFAGGLDLKPIVLQ